MSHFYSGVLLGLNIIFVLFPMVLGKNPLIAFKISSWILMLFIVIVGPFSVIVKDEVFQEIPISSRVVYDLSFVFLYVTNIYISFISVFKQKKLSKLLTSVLKDITKGFEFAVYVAVFLAIHLVNTICILLAQVKRTQSIKYYLTVFFVDGFLTFRLIGGLFMIFLLMNNLKKRFKNLNRCLKHWNKANSLKHFRQLHNELCDYVQSINDCFGVILVLIIFYFITSFLRHAVYIKLNAGDYLATAVRCLWILSYGFQAAYLAYTGEQITKETENTVAICYKLVPKSNCDEVHGNGNNELLLLSQQAFSRSTKISAAGFFKVDNTMILFMATTFFTYFIVVMQILAPSK